MRLPGVMLLLKSLGKINSVNNLASSNDGVGLNLSRRQEPDISGETHSIRLRQSLRIGTWNVRSLKGTGKINLLEHELERYNWSS